MSLVGLLLILLPTLITFGPNKISEIERAFGMRTSPQDPNFISKDKAD
ncbi:MAG: twin-arginine translocase TatA/TatE family subunit [Thermicanus sp.]|nr:twin-arginine translocase TatA/TatE family subunit [Thermicanus sp.]